MLKCVRKVHFLCSPPKRVHVDTYAAAKTQIKRHFRDLGEALKARESVLINHMKLEIDNKAAIAFSESEGCNTRTKHVDIRYHFVRDYISQGLFSIFHISSVNNTSDLLTKILSQEVQGRLTEQLMVTSPE